MSGVHAWRGIVTLIAGFFATFWMGASSKASEDPVDALIVLAIDVSSSVSGEKETPEAVNEVRIQREGTARALRSVEVARRLQQCNRDGIGLTIVEWSGTASQVQVQQILPWRRLKEPQDLENVAQFLDNRSGRSFSNGTDIATALTESLRLLNESPFQSHRRIITISGDGDQGVFLGDSSPDPKVQSVHLERARARVLESGVTIDAIVVMASRSGHLTNKPLDEYFDTQVVGGPGGSTIGIRSVEEYAEAFEEYLKRELNNCFL